MSQEQFSNYEQIAKIKVIGVGGAGNNAINRMIEDGVEGVEFIAANTDAQVLSVNKASTKIILGRDMTKGLGAGANPDIGRQAAVESRDEIRQHLEGADMIFIAAGMGGGTGTGAAPVIAEVAQDIGALTVGIITTPFTFEGHTRNTFAKEGTHQLRQHVDSLIIIANDRLLEIIGGVPLKDSFKEADNILRQGVQTITDLIAVPSLINLDFADAKNVMKNKGNALFGIGLGKGPNKAIEAANRAIISPLLDADIKGAKDAIINVTGGKTMTLHDANDAVDIVRQATGRDVNIIFGVAINEHLEDQMILTVIATGFEDKNESQVNIETPAAPTMTAEDEARRFSQNGGLLRPHAPKPTGSQSQPTYYSDDAPAEHSFYASQNVNPDIASQYDSYYSSHQHQKQNYNDNNKQGLEQRSAAAAETPTYHDDLPPFLQGQH